MDYLDVVTLDVIYRVFDFVLRNDTMSNFNQVTLMGIINNDFFP